MATETGSRATRLDRTQIKRLEDAVDRLTSVVETLTQGFEPRVSVWPGGVKRHGISSKERHESRKKVTEQSPSAAEAKRISAWRDVKSSDERERLVLSNATARGEAAKVEWVRSGELVPAKQLAEAWALTPQALGPAESRGEIFSLLVKRRRYFPREFQELERADVAAVCKHLVPLGPSEKLVFWKRPHGALGGRTVSQVLSEEPGEAGLLKASNLAKAWSEQARADAFASA